MVVGILVAIIIIVLFFVYGLPALRGSNQPNGTNINVTVPGIGGDNSGGTGGGGGGTGGTGGGGAPY
jgi:hypothetical protein